MDNGYGAGVALESLEGRLLFCLLGHDGLDFGDADGPGRGDARGGKPASGPEIRADLVALHEFGHSLGLGHNGDPNSIMYAYYNGSYDVAKLGSDVAVTQLRSLYSSSAIASNQTAWRDSLDASPNDGSVDLTYSFVLDGARMEQGGRSNTFATLDARFGAGTWQSVFTAELDRWASVSGGALSFAPFDDDGIENGVYGFNASGSQQQDARFGDIRIATHRFDGAGGTLAHAYFPPPNGATAAGDAHFDSGENWVLPGGSGGGSSSSLSGAVASADGAPENSVLAEQKRSPFGSVRIVADESPLA